MYRFHQPKVRIYTQASRDGQRNYAIVQLLLQTGIRLDECSQLTLDDIEFGERSGRLTIRQGKGNKARTVPLNASARQALAEYLAPRLHCDATVKAVARAGHIARPVAHPCSCGRVRRK